MFPHPHMAHQHHFISLSKMTFVPYNQIIRAIDSPSTSPSGRIYKLSRLSRKTIKQSSNN